MNYFPYSSDRFYYAFNHGNVHFILLDSGEDKPDSHPVYADLADFDHYRDEQTEWLKKDINSNGFKEAVYRIVFTHIPLFSGNQGHGAQYITEKWGPVLNEAGIDVVFSGHTHRYAFIKPTEGQNVFPIMIIGKDMIAQTDVSKQNLSIVIMNNHGETVDKISIYSKIR